MKIREKYRVFNHARREYSRIFSQGYEFRQMSYKNLVSLLKANEHSSFCEYWYCCHGLYSNCWQDPFEEGVWSMSQEDVNVLLAGVLKRTRKYLKNKHRVLYFEDSYGTHVVLVTRDVLWRDYIITFTNGYYSMS